MPAFLAVPIDCTHLDPDVTRFKTVAIVGVGLIGGSIGLALRKRGLADRVVGIGRRQTSLRTARRVGAVTNTTVDLEKGVAEADLVVVCSPVGTIVEHVRAAAEHCPPETLITDTGSTKQSIVESLDGGLARGCRFLGGHPLAGSEKTGPSHARAELFEGRVAVLTPTRNTQATDYDVLEQFWSDLGSVVIRMSADEHDRALAITSHLPHALAVALAATTPEKYFRLSGAGFQDTTRLAAGSPELWAQILSLNRRNVLEGLRLFERQLAAIKAAVEAGDLSSLKDLLEKAKKNRDALGN
jgi:prephenate dehydrogenase